MQHAGWKAPAWATRWAVPTGMELCGLAVAVTVFAGKRERERERQAFVSQITLYLVSCLSEPPSACMFYEAVW